MKQGDFTGLAENYARFRPGYSSDVLDAVLALVGKSPRVIDAVDVGAGTGILTRELAARDFASVIAVEPNDDMRKAGIAGGGKIRWVSGSAENTSLPPHSADLLTMASSFHWADFARATAEFARVLKPRGIFCAMWNPRIVERNPILAKIEAHLHVLEPNLKRVSSGRSGITETLSEKLRKNPFFGNVLYLEGEHTVTLSTEHYIGAWRSVNDVQAQLGPERFAAFLEFIRNILKDETSIEATYLTRAWVAKCK